MEAKDAACLIGVSCVFRSNYRCINSIRLQGCCEFALIRARSRDGAGGTDSSGRSRGSGWRRLRGRRLPGKRLAAELAEGLEVEWPEVE